jgi:hypothetical protein
MLTLFILSCCCLPLLLLLLQWGIYDSFKVAAGLPTTGAKIPTPAK